MSAPIMSRFDLFFILVDDCNEVEKLMFIIIAIIHDYDTIVFITQGPPRSQLNVYLVDNQTNNKENLIYVSK